MGLQQAKPWEVGCDEVGRGALAGPVVAAAVCFPKTYSLPGLQDSKCLSCKRRGALGIAIRKQSAWAIGAATVEEIDTLNILGSSILAMHRALDRLVAEFRHILVDGLHFKPYLSVPYRCVVRGDSQYDVMAAASIIAKTYRDELMEKAALQHSFYGWAKNKGYPTLQHRRAIQQHGRCTLHRKSFHAKLVL